MVQQSGNALNKVTKRIFELELKQDRFSLGLDTL